MNNQLNRRNFIGMIGTAAGAACISPRFAFAELPVSSRKSKVDMVGNGFGQNSQLHRHPSMVTDAEHKRFFAYRSFWPEFEAMKNFGQAGIDTYAFMPSNAYNSMGEPYCKYPPIWCWDETYDWEVLDRQFDDIISVNPRARFICMVDINSPRWLAMRINRRLGIGGDSYHSVSTASCTKEWRDLTEKYFVAYLKHVEAKYGDRINAYMIAGGGTSEWYESSHGLSNVEKETAFKAWRQAHGKPPVNIPSQAELNMMDFEGRLRDPQKREVVMDYAWFTCAAAGGLLADFAKIARDIVGKDKEIGSFSGWSWSPWGALFDAESKYSIEHIDFFGAPPPYDNTREVGGGGGFQTLHGSPVRWGKGWFVEIDHRTHTYNSQLTKYVRIRDYFNAQNQAETDAILKREFSSATIHHASLFCFDMWGGVFSTPETMEIVKKAHEIWQKYKTDISPLACEIALIADPRDSPYINSSNFADVRKRLTSFLGAPFEFFSFGDIGAIDLSKFKMVIFQHSYEITPEREAILKEHVFKNGRTVLLNGAFGISDGKTLDTSRVKKYTGFDYGTKGLSNEKEMDGWTCVYVSSLDDVTPEFLRATAEKAGVHMYLDELLPAIANEKLLCVTTKEGGKKTVHLPRKCAKIVELYTGQVVAKNTDKFGYNFKSPDTALFELHPHLK